MNLEGVMSISGKSGLFKMVGRTSNGVIVESLETGKRFPVHSTNKVSALTDISIYGVSEDLPLGDIYEKLYETENGKKSLSDKDSPDKMREKLEEIFPDFDEERVYASDLKKLFKWYNTLLETGYFEEQKADKPAEKKEEEREKDKNKSGEEKAE